MSVAETLSDRMKEYENITQTKLIKKQPVIIRLDGKAFHTFTKNLTKPFDIDLSKAFEYTCIKLKEKIDNVKFIYSQSDEISLLLTDLDKLTTDAWYDYRIQKIVSVSASLATMYFNEYVDKICNNYKELYDYTGNEEYKAKSIIWQSKKYKASFDSRAFNLPMFEISNYLIYRIKDAIRNSKQALGQSYFSHKELSNKSANDIISMVKECSGIDWNELSNRQKQGFCLYKDKDTNKWIFDEDIPDIVNNREFIDRHIL